MTDIEVKIRELILESGAITFEKFMTMALYGDGDCGGYYNSGNTVWGLPSDGGDYVTNSDISDTFAVMLGKCFFEMWQSLGSPNSFTLFEVGAGRGTLALGIIKSASQKSETDKHWKNFLNSLSVIFVDKGVAFTDSLASINALLKNDVKVFGDIEDVKDSFVGVVYSNELFDAMPVNLLFSDSGLKEFYVDIKDGQFVEILKDISDNKLVQYFKDLDIEIYDGVRCEVNLHMKDFVIHASRLIKQGYMLTVDYGYPAKVLYESSRKDGTLYCHYKHKLNDKPLTNVGLQDITAHIDFTSLANFGTVSGLELVGFTTQSAFLLGLGVTDEFEALLTEVVPSAEAVKRNQAIKELVLPGGVGDTFKVMVQGRVDSSEELSCFSFKNLKDKLI